MKRAIEVVFANWLIFITIRYAETVLKSLSSPFNPGWDIRWSVLWLIGVAVIAGCLFMWSRALRILLALTFVGAITISFLSGGFLPAFFCLWFVVVAYAWGIWLLRLAGVERGDLIDSIAIAVPVGFVVPAMTGFLLAAAHLFTVTSLWLLLLGLTALQFRTLVGLRRTTTIIGKLPFDAALPLAIMLPVVLLNLTWAVAPEIQFDANNYHLAVPRIYLENGSFIDLPYSFHSYTSHLAEMLFAFPMALQGQTAAKLLSFALSLVAGCCVFSLGKEAFDTRIGSWATAYFCTTPIVSWLAGTAYTDHIIAMFLTAAVLAFVKWRKNPASAGWLYISSLLASLAIACKINTAFGLVAIMAVACWNIRRVGFRRAGLIVLITSAVVLPWYALTYHWTGNPVIPYLNGFFKSPLWAPVNQITNSNEFGIGTSRGSIIRLPFRYTFNTERFGEASPRGSAGVALLIAFPFSLILLWREKRIAGLLIGTFAIYFLAWAYTFQYSRYFVPILPVVCVLAAATAFSADSFPFPKIAIQLCLALGLIAQFPTNPVQFWNIPERFPVRMALGLETREHFLDRTLVGYGAVRHLNTDLKPAERVIGVGVEQIRLYLNAPLETLADASRVSKLRDVVGMPPDRALLKSLRSSGFTYILTTRTALVHPTDEYPYLKDNFLADFATIEFMDAETALYRLNPE
jgi:hypothetical protein